MHKDKKDYNFDKMAAKYDNGIEGRMSERFYRLLLAEVELFPGANVLDVGCGTGTVLRKMADTYPINGYGIDMTENMITEAQKKCPDMHIQVCRCESTSFESQTFDIITACMAYHHFADKKGFAIEAARLLKPGGHLYIADPRFPFVIRKFLNGVFRLVNVAGSFYNPEEIHEHFGEYGFTASGFAFDGYAQVVKLKRL